jgi:DNA-binding CsgD family transcriptional regulator
MISTGELSELLTTLYAAPLEPDKWQIFFDRLCVLANISCGYLVTSYPNEGNLVLAGGGWNSDPEVFLLYNEYRDANDPCRVPLVLNTRAGSTQGDGPVSRAALVRSELFSEVVSRYNLEYISVLSCNWTADRAELLSLWRSPKHGPMDPASVDLLHTLVPHVQTALRVRTEVAASNTSKLFADTALDAMSSAVFLVTSTGYVKRMNTLAAAFVRKDEGLRLEGASLKVRNPIEDANLRALISEAASAGAATGAGLSISRQGARPLHVSVLPLPESHRLTVGVPCALVLVNDPAALPKSRATLMRTLYCLTPTESRLADLLLHGLEVREAADRLRMALGTARFHLKRVLAKTGTRRQTELMRLMLSLPGE